MKVAEVRAIAARRGIAAGGMKKGALIRTMQQAEGNDACFDTGQARLCGQENCLWRDDCH